MPLVACKYPTTRKASHHVVGYLSENERLYGILDVILHTAVFVWKHADVAGFLLIGQSEVPVIANTIGSVGKFRLLALAEPVNIRHDSLHLTLGALVCTLGHVTDLRGSVKAVDDVMPCRYTHQSKIVKL
mgnify:CR=1 FL=1